MLLCCVFNGSCHSILFDYSAICGFWGAFHNVTGVIGVLVGNGFTVIMFDV